MAANKNRPADPAAVEVFIDELGDDRRADESRQLIEILRRVTGHPPVLWGTSIIGFDQFHYRYDSGHEGDTAKLAFSPRKAKISLYGIGRDGPTNELLARLGKHSLGKGCVYVNKLTDIDLAVLEALFTFAYSVRHPNAT